APPHVTPSHGLWNKIANAASTKQPARRKRFFRPEIELLESRTLFAVRVWTGAAVPVNLQNPLENGDPRWSTAFNWAPINGTFVDIKDGDDLVFPAGIAD